MIHDFWEKKSGGGGTAGKIRFVIWVKVSVAYLAFVTEISDGGGSGGGGGGRERKRLLMEEGGGRDVYLHVCARAWCVHVCAHMRDCACARTRACVCVCVWGCVHVQNILKTSPSYS